MKLRAPLLAMVCTVVAMVYCVPSITLAAESEDGDFQMSVDSVLRMAYIDSDSEIMLAAADTEVEDTTSGELIDASEDATGYGEYVEYEEVEGEEVEFLDEETDVEFIEEGDTELIELDTERDLGPGIELLEDEEAADLISITLDEVPLTDVVRMFTRISGANIVAGTNLHGTVTVSLQDVEWEPALQVILDSVDLALVEKNPGIYSVLSKDELASEPVTAETIFLNFTTVTNVLPVVRQMLVSTNASASGFPAANAIIIQETSARIQKIKDTIAIIDKPRPQVFIEAKFVELNDQAIKDIGIDWQVLQGYSVKAGGLGYSYEKTRDKSVATAERFRDFEEETDERTKRSNRLESRASGSASSAGLTTTVDADEPPDDFTFEDKRSDSSASASIFGDNVEDFDIAEGTLTAIPTRESENIRRRENSKENTIDKIFDTITSQVLGATLSANEFQLTLSALKQNDGVSVVSNPKIVVASGETASIHVGRNEPNVVAVPQGDTGDRFAYQLDSTLPFIEIGVKLSVTPVVNTEENITVDIAPELSRLLGNKVVGEANTSFPITQIRSIQTEFNLESGHTVAIGGLTESSDVENVIKIPILGDIPIIGKYLFSHTHTETLQDEVVIFVTVGLAKPSELVEASGIPSGGRLIHRHMAQQTLQSQGADE